MNYYDILGVTTNADEREIKSAFRRLAKQYHPDISTAPRAQDHFRLVHMAYEVLSDPQKRTLYDNLQRLKTYAREAEMHRAQAYRRQYRPAPQPQRQLSPLSRHSQHLFSFVTFLSVIVAGGFLLLSGCETINNEHYLDRDWLSMLAIFFGLMLVVNGIVILFKIIKIWTGSE